MNFNKFLPPKYFTIFIFTFYQKTLKSKNSALIKLQLIEIIKKFKSQQRYAKHRIQYFLKHSLLLYTRETLGNATNVLWEGVQEL
jgi:hypothetical protein